MKQKSHDKEIRTDDARPSRRIIQLRSLIADALQKQERVESSSASR